MLKDGIVRIVNKLDM